MPAPRGAHDALDVVFDGLEEDGQDVGASYGTPASVDVDAISALESIAPADRRRAGRSLRIVGMLAQSRSIGA